jgi:hypothetical protein
VRAAVAVLLAALLPGCGSAPPPSAEVAPAADSTEVAAAGRPASDAEDPAVGPRLAPAPPAPQPLSPLERLVEGFRVQLFQSTSLRLAESFRDNAVLELGVPVYLEYEAPLYKVRAGNFRLRAEAEAWAGQLSGRGYQRADVVATLVDTGAPVPARNE